VHLSHHSVLSNLNQNPHLRCMCGKTVDQDGRDLIINTMPHLSQHPMGSCETAQLWPEEHRMRVRGCDTARPSGTMHIAWIYETLTRVHGNQELQMIDSAFSLYDKMT